MFREVILSIAVALLIGDYQFCASKTPVASTAISVNVEVFLFSNIL
jgi:hypothetical protein